MANWFLDSEPKCHETAWFRFTIYRSSEDLNHKHVFASGLNGKDAKHLKDVSFQTPKVYQRGYNHHAPNSKFSFLISRLKQMCSKMHETSVQILSNLLFNPPELTLRNLFPCKHWACKLPSATPQSPWHLRTFALTSSSPQGFHRTVWSLHGRRSHLRLEGRSTWLPKISRDTRYKNINNVYAIWSEWQRHHTSQRHKSPSF